MTFRIDAASMFDGEGFVRDASLVVDGPTIIFAGPRAELPPEYQSLSADAVATLTPGLWDVHTHFFGVRQMTMAEMLQTRDAVAGMRVAKDAERLLAAGFTSVREAGGYGVHLAAAIEEGTVIGPRIYGAGAVLSPTAGHGDLPGAPLEWLTGDPHPPQFHLCDGVDECIRAVRLQIRKGARVIKVCASGGILGAHDSPHHQHFSDAELRAIVEEASLTGRTVMAHATGKAGILASVRAGVRTIEHGTYLDQECVDAMLEAGVILVPTLSVGRSMLRRSAALSAAAADKLRDAVERSSSSVQLAYAAGVPIAAGSDFGTSGPDSPTPQERGIDEIGHLQEAGLSPVDALRAATSVAASTLGDSALASGRLRAGADADFLEVGVSLEDDAALIATPGAVRRVWKAGKMVVSHLDQK
ncbi:amidohydrolase family protein [Paenarthrobacter sp. NPDC056912]|uniref:metal-dependent hydrolase family protein n=1 Tax=Paenarthrobacter sp. NPDC056912 TaxID=3345965 RepID=UPI0036726C2E